mmetsp:Transcript_9987/g.15108  ORF Transcript_9987/g.15108 Transcript_9987/m.15108 type:complete len:122 (+) Transcript_9987:628-993(+)|eukprot:CAMPEP_0170481982 /NCGR_PEP_ID=MMETSP0208-20121228/2208_1 /TAXON_ID=197538 /ORGANISM="Strombidium inclinatum, Strain S3" /LENGTH=121 /DNA_ID=CAMNT_0010754775 /DNA_START=567 /DNA_END=932 /DNA_ORIENTATION=-
MIPTNYSCRFAFPIEFNTSYQVEVHRYYRYKYHKEYIDIELAVTNTSDGADTSDVVSDSVIRSNSKYNWNTYESETTLSFRNIVNGTGMLYFYTRSQVDSESRTFKIEAYEGEDQMQEFTV